MSCTVDGGWGYLLVSIHLYSEMSIVNKESNAKSANFKKKLEKGKR